MHAIREEVAAANACACCLRDMLSCRPAAERGGEDMRQTTAATAATEAACSVHFCNINRLSARLWGSRGWNADGDDRMPMAMACGVNIVYNEHLFPSYFVGAGGIGLGPSCLPSVATGYHPYSSLPLLHLPVSRNLSLRIPSSIETGGSGGDGGRKGV